MAPALARAAVGAPGAFPRFARSGAALKQALPDAPIWYLQALARRTRRADVLRDDLAGGRRWSKRAGPG